MRQKDNNELHSVPQSTDLVQNTSAARRTSLSAAATNYHPLLPEQGDPEHDLTLTEVLLQSTSAAGRSSFRFDVTASGTTSRLHASLVGKSARQVNEESYQDDTIVQDTFRVPRSTESSVTTMSPTEHDPERTPLVGNRQHIKDEFRHSLTEASNETSPSVRVPQNTKKQSTTHTTAALRRTVGQMPAILLIGLFHLMIGIPFGVSYFPIGWRSADAQQQDAEAGDVQGPFPLPGKEALGIRMFLFSTAIGQIVFTLQSQFPNAIGLQMVENVPFCQTLARIVIQHQGYGVEALSTVLIIFAVSSIVVGTAFWVLGRYRLGRVIYFFPTHVLMGCIGGIGVFLSRTALEVTMDHAFAWAILVGEKSLLIGVVFGFETLLRVLEHIANDPETGESRYSLLAPIYFCMITPVFYAILWAAGVSLDSASQMGFFSPKVVAEDNANDDVSSSTNAIWALWSVINFRTVSLVAIWDAIPTIVALSLFSLIHVPINIPAFAISSNTEVDINNELVAHGYSNLIMGFVGGGGLQNYMAYTQSVLYARSGGHGRPSGICVVAVTLGLLVVGPTIASYIPRCMAGTLLLHVGIDLFLEAVYDSNSRFDYLEYTGVWLIVIVMTLAGLEAAMIAGGIAAVSTYAAQSITYLNPIRGSMSATTLRSSRYDRSHAANQILDDPLKGRSRILVFQLQGHLFFGNTAQLTEIVQAVVQSTQQTAMPWIVIMDFMLVLGIDSSAASAMSKLRTILRKQYSIDLCIFVTGAKEGFPTASGLSKELSEPVDSFSGSRVVSDLDTALSLAEDNLLYRYDPTLLQPSIRPLPLAHRDSGLTEEREVALEYLTNLAVEPFTSESIQILFSCFHREEYKQDEIIWRQGSPGDSAKIVVRGTLVARIEQEAGTSESVGSGNVIGELGLVYGAVRMSTVICQSEECVLYSVSREQYERLVANEPQAARILDLICIKYLTGRVQHVSNRIFETRCLPI